MIAERPTGTDVVHRPLSSDSDSESQAQLSAALSRQTASHSLTRSLHCSRLARLAAKAKRQKQAKAQARRTGTAQLHCSRLLQSSDVQRSSLGPAQADDDDQHQRSGSGKQAGQAGRVAVTLAALWQSSQLAPRRDGTGRLEPSTVQLQHKQSSTAHAARSDGNETGRQTFKCKKKSTVFASTHGIFIANTFCFIIFASSSYRH